MKVNKYIRRVKKDPIGWVIKKDYDEKYAEAWKIFCETCWQSPLSLDLRFKTEE